MAWNLYGPGADEILVRNQPDPAGYLYYHLDANGNVVFLLSQGSQAMMGLEKYTYDAFGKPTITGWNGEVRPISNYGNRFLFTGREYLYTLGLYDYRHRHYHPGLGRFLQTDPIGFGGDPMNLYRYCGGNPITHSDPDGLLTRDFMWDFASYTDSSNNLQGLFQDFTNKWYAGENGSGGGGNDNGKFYGGVRDFTGTLRKDGAGVDPKEVGRVLVDDAHDAAQETANHLRLGKHFDSGDERAYARTVHGSSLTRDGKQPAIGHNAFSGSQAGLPGFAKNGPAPLTGSHSHGPQQGPRGRQFQRSDIPSAEGHNIANKPYMSSLGWYRDPRGWVNIYIPGAGPFHSSDGVNFYSGQFK